MTKYDMLPEHMQPGARGYVEDGQPPGGFLTAVLTNDLTEAFGRADGINREYMFQWATWLYNECPGNAWGTQEAVDAWVEKGGVRGR